MHAFECGNIKFSGWLSHFFIEWNVYLLLAANIKEITLAVAVVFLLYDYHMRVNCNSFQRQYGFEFVELESFARKQNSSTKLYNNCTEASVY